MTTNHYNQDTPNNTPRVDDLINRMMEKYSGVGAQAQARYYEAVHQELAPFARYLERENAEMLALLRDCESYAGAMATFNNSGEGAQLAARCRELIAKAEGNTGSNQMCSCVECVPNGPDGPAETDANAKRYE